MHGTGAPLADSVLRLPDRSDVGAWLGCGQGHAGRPGCDTRRGACLVNNVEALLSTKSVDACEQWLQAFVDTTWHAALLVPIVINADRVPQGHARVVRVMPEQLSEQSFISRLAQ